MEDKRSSYWEDFLALVLIVAFGWRIFTGTLDTKLAIEFFLATASLLCAKTVYIASINNDRREYCFSSIISASLIFVLISYAVHLSRINKLTILNIIFIVIVAAMLLFACIAGICIMRDIKKQAD